MAISLRNSLAVRFLLTTVVMLGIAMGSGTMISLMITNRAMNEATRTQLQRQVEDTIGFVEMWFETQRVQISSLGREKVFRIALEDSYKGRAAVRAVAGRFSWLALSYPYFNNLNLLDTSGRVIASDLPDEDAAQLAIDPALLQRAVAGELVISPVFKSAFDQTYIFALYSSIVDSSGVVGVLYFEYSLQPFSDMYFSELQAGKSGFAMLLDHHNTIIVQPDGLHMEKDYFNKPQFQENSGKVGSQFFNYSYRDIDKIAYPGSIDDISCTLVLSVPSSELHAPSRQLFLINLYITVIVSVLAVLALFLLWRREISKPINELIQGINEFQGGKLRKPLKPQVRNEFITVAESFNTMVADIERSTVSISELREQQQNLQMILDSMNTGVLIVEMDEQQVMMVNAALLSILGISSLEEAGPDIIDNGRFVESLLTGLQENQIKEMKYTNSSGVAYDILRIVQRIFLSKTEVLLVTYVDISEQKKSEKERQALENDLQSASRLKAIGTLAAGVAHEINTPIQYIGDNVRFFAESMTDILSMIATYKDLVTEVDKQQRCSQELESIREKEDEIDLAFLEEEIPLSLQQSINGIEQVARIVQAMKTFSHHGEERLGAYDLNEGVENTLVVSRNEWKMVAEVETELADSLPELQCFVGDINQVLLNLIVNAAHAIEEKNVSDSSVKGRIIIRTYKEDGFVCVSVSDTGIGMGADVKARIFDPFYTTKEVGKGSGQGLSLASSVVIEKHGGRLEVETEPGVGSTFIVKLPIDIEPIRSK